MDILLSASSQLRPVGGSEPTDFSFRFSQMADAGPLLLKQLDEKDLLKEVYAAVHREPESHIGRTGDFVSGLLQAKGLKGRAEIFGISEKDKTLVDVLVEKLDGEDKGILCPSMHSIEVQTAVSDYNQWYSLGKQPIIVARHILEHAFKVDLFVSGIKKMMGKDGLCIFEVPDSQEMIEEGDLAQIWEEHRYYFNEMTLTVLLEGFGLRLLSLWKDKSEGESLLMAMVGSAGVDGFESTRKTLEREYSTGMFMERFSRSLISVKTSLQDSATERQIFLFGANHMASTFIDLIGDENRFLAGVFDDDVSKFGHTIGLGMIEVCELPTEQTQRPLHILVAVNQGRAPGLYERLNKKFRIGDGHVVEALTSFYRRNWV